MSNKTLDVLLCKLVKEARNDLFQGIVTFLQLKEVRLRNISNPIVIKDLWSTVRHTGNGAGMLYRAYCSTVRFWSDAVPVWCTVTDSASLGLRVLDLAVWCCCNAIRCFETQCWDIDAFGLHAVHSWQSTAAPFSPLGDLAKFRPPMLLTPCTEASWGHRLRCCRAQAVPKSHMNLLRRAACVPGIKTRPRTPSKPVRSLPWLT